MEEPLPSKAEQRPAGGLGLAALAAAGAVLPQADGSTAGSSSTALPTGAEGSTRLPAESLGPTAPGAAGLFPVACSVPETGHVPQQQRDQVTTPVSAAPEVSSILSVAATSPFFAAAAEAGQNTPACKRLYLHSVRGGRMAGAVAQRTTVRPPLAARSRPVGGEFAEASTCVASASSAACPSALGSRAVYQLRGNSRRRVAANVASHSAASLGATSALQPPTPPLEASRRTAGSAHSHAVPAAPGAFPSNCAVAPGAFLGNPAAPGAFSSSNPASMFSVSVDTASPPAGAAPAAADVDHPGQINMRVRRTGASTSSPATSTGSSAAAAPAGCLANATTAARGLRDAAPLPSVTAGGAAAAAPQRDGHGVRGFSVLLRKTSTAPTDDTRQQQRELRVHDFVIAAGRIIEAADSYDSVQKVSDGSRVTPPKVSADGVASRVGVGSSAAASGAASCAGTVAVKSAAHSCDSIGINRVATSLHELSLRLRPPAISVARRSQASSCSTPGTSSPPTASAGQLDGLSTASAMAYPIAGGGRTLVTACKTPAAGRMLGTAGAAATGIAAAGRGRGTAPLIVTAAARSAASGGAAGTNRADVASAGPRANAALRAGRASGAAGVAPTAAGFLQRTKRVPRESHRPSRRALPFELLFHSDTLFPAAPTQSPGFDSSYSARRACDSASVSTSTPLARAASPSTLPSRRASLGTASAAVAASGSVAASAAAACEPRQAEGRAGPTTESALHFCSKAASTEVAFRTPQQSQRPPWRALTPQQLLLQRAARKRLHAVDESKDHLSFYLAKPPSDNPIDRKESVRDEGPLPGGTTAQLKGENVEIPPAARIPTAVAAQRVLAEAEHRLPAAAAAAALPLQRPPSIEAITAAAVAQSVERDGCLAAQEGAAEVPAAADTPSGVAAAKEFDAPSAEADKCRQSTAAAPESPAGIPELCKSEGRRTRKPSRLSLEAAETYSLTIAFRHQRRASGRISKHTRSRLHAEGAASPSSNRRCVSAESSAEGSVPDSPAVAAEVQRQKPRQTAARTKRIRAAESAPKRRAVQETQERQQQPELQQHASQSPQEEEWMHLTASQQHQAATYAATLQQQPVFLESCSFMLYPPGFASSATAARRVCLSGTLQLPAYVPSAASLCSVQQTVMRQQQEAGAAISKTHANVSGAAEDARIAGTSSDNRAAVGSSKGTERPSDSKPGVRSIEAGEAEERAGSAVGFIENTTVSGYLYHWYQRMHVSAQLEAQVQQLSTARERLAQRLCDGSELHSNLFFFSLFPQDYGAEQFRNNLRFFPQYAITTAAAEAAGLQPLELYAESSCTAAIAETAYRAKLAEQLYEEDQLLKRRWREAELVARAQEQQQHKKVQQQKQQQKTVRTKGLYSRHVKPQHVSKLPSSSPATAARLLRHESPPPALAKNEEQSASQFAVPDATGESAQQSEFLSVPDTRLHRDVKDIRRQETADIPYTSKGCCAPRILREATGQPPKSRKSTAASASKLPAGAILSAGAAHRSATQLSASAACGMDGSECIFVAGGTSSCQADGSGVPGTNMRSAAFRVPEQDPPIPASGVDSTSPAAQTGERQPSENSSGKASQQVGDMDAREKGSETLRQGTAGAAEGRMDTKWHSTSGSLARESAAAEVTGEMDVGREERNASAYGEGTRVHSKVTPTHRTLEREGTHAIATAGEKHISHDGSSAFTKSVDCENEGAERPARIGNAAGTSRPAGSLILLNGCCTSGRARVAVTCDGLVTEGRSEIDAASNSRRSSTCDSSSCGDGNSRRAGSTGRRNSSTSRHASKSNSKVGCSDGICTAGRSTDTGTGLLGGSSKCNMSMSTAATVGGRSVRRGRRATIDGSTSATTTGTLNDDSAQGGQAEDKPAVVRGADDHSNAVKSDCSAPGGVRSATIADCTGGGTGPHFGAAGPGAGRATPVGLAFSPAFTGGGSRGGSNIRSDGGNGDDGIRKVETIAEARYVPMIPRVGTVEIASIWRLIEASEQMLVDIHRRQEREKPPQQLEEQLPVLVKTLPVWWMGSVELGMQQQLTVLTLQRVLPDLAAWQGKDLRLVGSVLPFAARGLLALALCQLEHRIAVLQQELAAAVGGLQVLMASTLLLQQVEEYYAPHLYSLPQHVLACLYLRGGGRTVAGPSRKKRSAVRHRALEFRPATGASPCPAKGHTAGACKEEPDMSSASSQTAGQATRVEGLSKHKSGHEELLVKPSPSWEAGVEQGAPVALESFVSYADAFEDYLPTLGKVKASGTSEFDSDTDDNIWNPVAADGAPRVIQRKLRRRAIARPTHKVKDALGRGTTKGTQNPGKRRGENGARDRGRKRGSKGKKGAAAKLQGRGTR